MKEDNMMLPRANAELAREYDDLIEKYQAYDLCFSNKSLDDITNRLNELHSGYDWSNYEFEDPNTGKKGVMDITGRILVPAHYDGFAFLGTYQLGLDLPKGALKDGKYGFVASDGSGKELTEFKYTYLEWDPYTGFYKACWGDDTNKFGYITPQGLVFIPNIIDRCYEPTNDFVLLEGNGKYGGLDTRTFHYVEPLFDNVEVEPEEEVVFYKNGVAGYVIEETSEFITIDQYDSDECYADKYVYNSFL